MNSGNHDSLSADNDPPGFDLNDIRHEPSDEQLAQLMESVATEARRRARLAREELVNNLQAAMIAARRLSDLQ